ncbi:MAG: nucleotidyltransferase family protein [Planctomycetes bacterium]|nr:nucleotidyltransferase family protein [Planctomycetota bacterium]
MVSAARIYAMLENETLWDAVQQAHQALFAADIPHVVIGGIAVCLHGYPRNTVDVDLLTRREDTESIREALGNAGFSWHSDAAEFRSPADVPVQFVIAGDRAGPDSEVRLPDPADERFRTELESLPVLSLPKVIESKIACGLGNLRRTHKDFADVVELIARHELSSAYARHLHKTLRKTFRELVRHARGG